MRSRRRRGRVLIPGKDDREEDDADDNQVDEAPEEQIEKKL